MSRLASSSASPVYRIPYAALQDRELVAAGSRHHVPVPQAPAKALGDEPEQRVPDRVATAVVDRLEPVEVDAVEGDGAVGLTCGRHLVEPIL